MTTLYSGRTCRPLDSVADVRLPTTFGTSIIPNRIYKKYIRPVVGDNFNEVYIIGSAIKHPGFITRKKYYYFGREVKKIKYVYPNDIDILIFTNEVCTETKEKATKQDKLIYFNDSYGATCYHDCEFHFTFTTMAGSYRDWNSLTKSAQRDGFPLIHRGNPMFYSENLKESFEWDNTIDLSFRDGSLVEWT